MTLKDWKDSGDYIQLGEYNLFLQQGGSGKPMLLIHGFPTASWDWSQVWSKLETHYRLIAPDMLGYGFSDKPYPHKYSIMEQADLMEALLKAYGIPEALVLAHDYGDTVAQELLARQQAGQLSFRMEKLVLLNGGLFPGAYRPRLIQKLLMSPIGPALSPFLSKRSLARTFQKIFGKQTQPTMEEVNDFWELLTFNKGKRVIPSMIKYIRERSRNKHRWTTALQEPRIPVRLIDGGVDPISGAHMARHYEQVIPNPDVIILAEIGHYPQWEAPDQVYQNIIEFTEP